MTKGEEKGAGESSMIVRALLWQLADGHFPDRQEIAAAAARKPDLLVLPEYARVSPSARTPAVSFVDFDRNIDDQRRLTATLDCAVAGGTIAEKEGGCLFNTCFVFRPRTTVGFYRKIHLTDGERSLGFRPGREYKVFEQGGFRLGVLICADVLHPESFDRMGELGADIIAVPTSSPYRAGERVSEKERRDEEIFVEGARRSRAFLLKVCHAGTIAGARLQGRSLAAAPWGVLARVSEAEEDQERLLSIDLSMRELREFRGK